MEKDGQQDAFRVLGPKRMELFFSYLFYLLEIAFG